MPRWVAPKHQGDDPDQDKQDNADHVQPAFWMPFHDLDGMKCIALRQGVLEGLGGYGFRDGA